jgi:hypothetical protein
VSGEARRCARQLLDLARRAIRLEFSSDLLAGISIVTALLLNEYLAGTLVVLMLSGVCLAFFSGIVAFGWGHKMLAVAAATVALIGYSLVLAGYSLSRSSDWESLTGGVMKGLLLLGSTLVVPAFIALGVHIGRNDFPYGFSFATGFLSFGGFLWFRKYSARLLS